MRVYLLVLLIAATVAYLTTPLARWCALRWGAITAVRDRDVHAIPTPRLGGMAMFAGILVAIVMASRLPFLDERLRQPAAARRHRRRRRDRVRAGRRRRHLGPRLADQAHGPGARRRASSRGRACCSTSCRSAACRPSARPGCATFLTVLTVVIAMNAVNFVDGLDGLAAGVLAIGGTAFFLYAYLLTARRQPGRLRQRQPRRARARRAGRRVRRLPAAQRLPGAHLHGRLGRDGARASSFSAAAIVVTGQIDPEQVLERQRFPAFLPMLLPFAVLLLPAARHGARDRPPRRRRQVAVPPRPHAPAPPAARSSATRTAARSRSCTSGPRCSPSASPPWSGGRPTVVLHRVRRRRARRHRC